MSILVSNLNTSSEEYKNNFAEYTRLLTELRKQLDKSFKPENQEAIELSKKEINFSARKELSI